MQEAAHQTGRFSPAQPLFSDLCLLTSFVILFSCRAFAEPAGGLPEVKTYDQLISAIRETRHASQSRIEQAVDQEKVREAWETGKLIDTHVLQHKERADYDKQVILRLAKDLNTSDDELYRMLQFARAYPIFGPARKLSWSHYEALLALNDAKEREEVEQIAEKENWSRDRIREEVRKRKASTNEAQEPIRDNLPAAKPGKFYTYRVVKAAEGPYKGKLALDLGFSNWLSVRKAYLVLGEAQKPKLKEGDFVTFSKGTLSLRDPERDEAISEIAASPAAPRNEKVADADLFTYNAYVTKVLDGDTFNATIDLGFGITTYQTLRLKGIDAPEIVSKEGKEAKAFLESVIASGAKQSPVLIRTVKSDKYDRYLADIFVSLSSPNGLVGDPSSYEGF